MQCVLPIQIRHTALRYIRDYRYVAAFALDSELATWLTFSHPPSQAADVVESIPSFHLVRNPLNHMDIRRHIMGLLGIALLLGGVGLLAAKGVSDSQWSVYASICIRVGLMLSAIWLAFPQVVGLSNRFPPWLIAAIGVTTLVIAVSPKRIVYLGPIIVAIAFLQFVGWLFKPLPNPKRQAKAASKDDQ